MSRKYTHMLVHAPKIMEMRSAGNSRREIANTLGLEVSQIKEFLKRHNSREREGIPQPKPRGRRPATTLQDYKRENQTLKRENDLLRSFLHAAGRR